MENNIFSPDWHYKKYYLGYITNSTTSMDMFFYSHEQRYVVKIRGSKGKLDTVIEAVEEFKLTQKQGESFCINVDYQKPSEIKEVNYRDLPEEVLNNLIGYVHISFPNPDSKYHIADVVLYDADTETVIPIRTEKMDEYEDAGIDQKADGYLIGTTDKNLKTYPERMISQLQGKPSEDLYNIYDVFKGKKVVLLGVAYLNSYSWNYSKYAELYFMVDDALCSLRTVDERRMSGIHYRFNEVKDIDKLSSVNGSSKEEFYFYGKEVEVAEYNLLNCNTEKFSELWEMGNNANDLWMPDEYFDYVNGFLASDEMFAFSLDDAKKCFVRVMTSKMEQIKGSSYNVKRKRFLQKVASIVES